MNNIYNISDGTVYCTLSAIPIGTSLVIPVAQNNSKFDIYLRIYYSENNPVKETFSGNPFVQFVTPSGVVLIYTDRSVVSEGVSESNFFIISVPQEVLNVTGVVTCRVGFCDKLDDMQRPVNAVCFSNFYLNVQGFYSDDNTIVSLYEYENGEEVLF